MGFELLNRTVMTVVLLVFFFGGLASLFLLGKPMAASGINPTVLLVLFLVVFFGGLIGLAVLFGSLTEKSRNEVFREFARKHVLRFTPGEGIGTRLSGSFKGKEFKCEVKTRGVPISRTKMQYIYFEMGFKQETDFWLVMDYRALPPGLVGQTGKYVLYGGKEPPQGQDIGLPEFQKDFRVSTSDPGKAREFLSPGMQEKLRGVLRHCYVFALAAGKARVELQEDKFNKRSLEDTAGLLSFACDTATRLKL